MYLYWFFGRLPRYFRVSVWGNLRTRTKCYM
jgi:hypothetical protein